MNFQQAISLAFRKYVTFSGRASRSEYWYWMLFVVLANIVLGIVGSMSPLLGILTLLFAFGTFLPGLAVWARRLHDLNHSGWWIAAPLGLGIVIAFMSGFFEGEMGAGISGILMFLALLLVIWVAYIWPIFKGTAGDNRFGADPLA